MAKLGQILEEEGCALGCAHGGRNQAAMPEPVKTPTSIQMHIYII